MNIFEPGFNPYEEFVLKEDYINYAFGIYAPEGMIGHRTETGVVSGSEIYEFKAFEVYKVYLEITKNTQKQTGSLLSNLSYRDVRNGLFFKDGARMRKRPVRNAVRMIEGKQEENIWQFFGAQILCIIFAYTTLEAFANKILYMKLQEAPLHEIAKIDALFRKQDESRDLLRKVEMLIAKRNDPTDDKSIVDQIAILFTDSQSNINIELLKDNFIQQTSIEQKLFEVIPKLYHIEGQLKKIVTLKDRIKRLSRLRNIFIHLKLSDLRSGVKNPNAEKVWGELVPKFSKKKNELRFKPYDLINEIVEQITQAIYRPQVSEN
jgi:hypothetical protein